jgi:16S rRNA (cytidine1402-2'-O)-methyltransferase
MTPAQAALLQQAAASVAAAQSFPTGALYVVATPIGNLADISLRAIHVLSLVDAVACEDTRHSAPLLRQLGIDGKPLLAVHEHNERDAAGGVLARLARGERVAYISDAGTPAISDPGAALVAAALAAGHPCVPIPGASSATAALSVAGDAAGGGFRFVGFLPSRGGERSLALKVLTEDPQTLILFEAPHRIEALADALASACAGRMLTVCREVTKQFESIHRVLAAEFPAWLAADAHRCRGEFVIVVHALPKESTESSAPAHDATLRTLMATLPLKQAVALAAELTGAPRNALYERALALRNEVADPPAD